MTRDQLISKAASLDAEANKLSATIAKARDAQPADSQGAKPYLPTGQEANLARMTELRGRARRLRAEAGDEPKSVTPPVGRVALPAPAAVAACKAATVGGGLSAATIQQAAVAVRAETERALAILAEARQLAIGEAAVSAALAEGISPAEFVQCNAPAEALARQVAESTKAAGL